MPEKLYKVVVGYIDPSGKLLTVTLIEDSELEKAILIAEEASKSAVWAGLRVYPLHRITHVDVLLMK